ncbi:hypothetical protein [Caldibacillus debilis]|uniref:hypothetical protein n=1 Tax=Caldibacillus debilis TaxID=301148 RepID=UPI0012B56982|nr:hypothetical protein [Caldibacillus debilis]
MAMLTVAGAESNSPSMTREICRLDHRGGNLLSVEKNVENGLISIGDTRVRDVLEYEEEKDNYPFIGRDANGYEVKELFKKRLDKGKRPDAVLITENGNADDAPLGIITSWAMLKRYKGVSAENGLPEGGRTLTGPPFYFMKTQTGPSLWKSPASAFHPVPRENPFGTCRTATSGFRIKIVPESH